MPRTTAALVNSCLLPAYAGRTPADWILRAADDGLAGVALFGSNLLDPRGTLREDITDRLRAVRPDLLIALDEEGGDVTRLDYLTGSAYPGNHALGAVDDPELTTRVAGAIAADLAAAGVNLCLAPCADVNSRPDNPIIGVRSFGADPDLVARHTAAFVTGLQQHGVAATLKHFPGHGDTRTDSHTALPDVDRDLDQLDALDLPPFAAGIAAGARAVMTGHIRLPRIDPLPATLSGAILSGLLRDRLGFRGTIVTDALDMAPIVEGRGFGGAAVAALAAGSDLVLLGSPDGEKLLPEIHEAVELALRDGRLTEQRLTEAAARVADLRAWAHPRATAPAPDRAVGLAAARRALTAHGTAPAAGPRKVHAVRLGATANLAVGEAPWGLAAPLAALGALAGSTEVEPGTDPDRIPLPADGLLAVAVRDAHRDPWQRDTLRALRTRRPDLIAVEFGLAPDATAAPTLLARGAGLANATAAAEYLAGGSSRPGPAPADRV
ncbi:glycoside hydrolase family 3 N-terminal domain-containing protein [Kitasatospora sp. NPDC049258]|uniref:glycoside hydrolase family 3 N-terminal domain-containing protein n=1 Tax=Kitasatospora sp. NPDC049258 TaxID=3155394 RepID=UPI0034223D67